MLLEQINHQAESQPVTSIAHAILNRKRILHGPRQAGHRAGFHSTSGNPPASIRANGIPLLVLARARGCVSPGSFPVAG
jgi:hypothetical protein